MGSSDTTYERRGRSHAPPWAWVALGALTAVRCVVAAVAPLSPDEAYYWVWSRALAPGYLDHPPMVALWIWLGTALAGDTGLGVRLLAPVAAAVGSVLLADAGRVLFGSRAAGIRAAVLMNATLMLGAGAVTMTPDTPLLFFWTAGLWAMARIAAGGGGRWWLLVGVAAGLGSDSKYTALLLGVGAFLWLLTPGMRPALRTPWPWAGGAVAAALFLPVVLWNAQHGWASFVKQGGRTGDWAPGQALRFGAELLGGQMGLATPAVFALFVMGVAAVARRWREPGPGLLAAMVLPGAVVFVQHALGDRVQANWVAVLYPAAAVAAGGLAYRWWVGAAGLGLVLTAALYLQVVAPLPLPRGLDPTQRLAGWSGLAREAGALAQASGAVALASEEYGAASLLAWWGPGVPVVAVAARWRLFDLPAADGGGPVLLLHPRRRQGGPDPALWGAATPAGSIIRRRGEREMEVFDLYLVHPAPGAPSVRLPTGRDGVRGAGVDQAG